MAQGMTPEEARRNALIEFGGVEQARERCQEQEPGWWMDTLLQDVRYGAARIPAVEGICRERSTDAGAGYWSDHGSIQRGGPDSVSRTAVCGCGTAGFGGVHIRVGARGVYDGEVLPGLAGEPQAVCSDCQPGRCPHPCDLVENHPAS